MHDLEAGHVRHGPLEARVLGAGDDDGVEVVGGHGVADEPVAPVDLRARHRRHDASKPFTSAQIAAFSGVGTPCCSPNRTMPPFR